jgi:predicted nucleotidyltransferase
MDRQLQLKNALDHILQILVEEYRPQQVILFGSMAAGDTGEWSDIDLVIIKDTSKRFLARLKEVALLCRAPVGVDYLVYTPREFEQLVAENNPFIQQEILEKGKVLYEQ